VLHALRSGAKYKALEGVRAISVSAATVWRDMHHIVPILCCSLHAIRFPADPLAAAFEDARCAVDCSTHPRNRIHPGQHLIFRGDKRFHFLASQLIVGLTGKIFRLDIALGHHNDPGVALYSGFKQFLINNGWACLADGTYGDPFIIPNADGQSAFWTHTQRDLRSIVESVFALVKMFEVARMKNTSSLHFHAICLYAIFQIVAMRLQQYPLRDDDVYELVPADYDV
jgi:hypothetical protein